MECTTWCSELWGHVQILLGLLSPLTGYKTLLHCAWLLTSLRVLRTILVWILAFLCASLVHSEISRYLLLFLMLIGLVFLLKTGVFFTVFFEVHPWVLVHENSILCLQRVPGLLFCQHPSYLKKQRRPNLWLDLLIKHKHTCIFSLYPYGLDR